MKLFVAFIIAILATVGVLHFEIPFLQTLSDIGHPFWQVWGLFIFSVYFTMWFVVYAVYRPWEFYYIRQPPKRHQF